MENIQEKIDALEQQLRVLRMKHKLFNDDIVSMQDQLAELKRMASPGTVEQTFKPNLTVNIKPDAPIIQTTSQQIKQSTTKVLANKNLEDFIGTNLTSKIGILITIIGVFIGAKYAIDKELISPLMRIILGYAVGSLLIGIAIKLKPKYENFSAVLIGGGLSVVYFITYIAYNYYKLFPQAAAFGLMVVITIATVQIALWYNQKIIAILGQVGAYAVPFLLSDGSGNVVVLFVYISIINIGLLYLSFKKDWKILYRIAFFLTWLIAASWVLNISDAYRSFWAGLTFFSATFLTFYATFLAYKIVRKNIYNTAEVGVLLLNALIYFFLGYYLIDEEFHINRMLTLFTAVNALIHLTIGYVIYKMKLADESVYQFILGLGLLFITIVIPIELDGNWVTLLWAFEAAILVWIGIKNDRQLYLKIAAPVVLVACISLLHDWILSYNVYNPFYVGNHFERTPFLNNIFLLSLLAAGALCLVYLKSQQVKTPSKLLLQFYEKLVPLLFWVVLYFTFYNEIYYAWELQLEKQLAAGSTSARYYRELTLFIYTFVFVAALFELNKRFIQNHSLDARLLVGGILLLVLFLTSGLFALGELREEYVKSNAGDLLMITFRYVVFICIALFFVAAKQATDRISTPNSLRILSIVFNATLLAIICNEFIHWMDISGYQNQYKLGLSIICALYALALIFIGITYKKKHLRISAIILFSATLLKLFFYDLASLSTISKTIVLVILGIILLIISFLYNKYKHIILGED